MTEHFLYLCPVWEISDLSIDVQSCHRGPNSLLRLPAMKSMGEARAGALAQSVRGGTYHFGRAAVALIYWER